MAHATLVHTRHDEYGFNGWRLKRHPTFEPVDARGVAHDLLEHAPRDNGRVIEEMRALGAFTFTRIDSGLLYEEYKGRAPVSEILGMDILATFRNATGLGYNGSHLKEKASRWKLPDYEEYEAAFRDAIAYAHSHWANELGEDELTIAQADEYFTGHGAAVLMTALRAGFRWAGHRYHSPHRAATLFQRIEAKVKEASDIAELGDELVVHYNLSSLAVKLTHRDTYGFERW